MRMIIRKLKTANDMKRSSSNTLIDIRIGRQIDRHKEKINTKEREVNKREKGFTKNDRHTESSK